MKPIRVPIAADLTDRELAYAGSYGTDTMLVNCYVETDRATGEKFVVKRPGYATSFLYNGGGATSGQGTTYYKGCVFAMGSNVLYRLNGGANIATDGSAWTFVENAPWLGRLAHGAVVFNNQIIVLGGVDSVGNYYSDVWGSADGVTWSMLTSAAPWAARAYMAVAVLGDTLYLIGGNSITYYNDVWSTKDGVNWTQAVSDMGMEPRQGAAVAVFNNTLVRSGGFGVITGYTVAQEVWSSPDGKTWTKLTQAAAWPTRYQHTSVVYQNKIWVMGGRNAAVHQDAWSSPDGITWTNTGNMPGTRKLMASCIYNNKIFLLGGTDNAGNRSSTVWSTTDGATFTVVSADYSGAGVVTAAAQLIVYRTPASINQFQGQSMLLLGGASGGGGAAAPYIYQGTLNVSIASSFTPTGTGAGSTEQWNFATQNVGDYLIAKNTKDAWVLVHGALQKIASDNYPTITVPGIVNLDDTVYVMDQQGQISGSNLSDPFSWSSMNFITADYEADAPVALAKYQNFVVAFKTYTTQFFYNAGRYPASPLLPVKNANMRIGCVAAGSICSIDNTLMFMARSETAGRYIAMLDGYAPVRVSTPDVERILNSWAQDAFVYAYPLRVNGHDFYILTLKSANVTLVYDVAEKRWHTWASGSNYFAGASVVSDGAADYLQDLLLGKLYTVSPVQYQDAGSAITVSALGDKIDGGTNAKKFCSSLSIIGDRRCNSIPNTATISWSDDDGQSFSAGVTVDLSQARPRINRCGSFRRRKHKLVHASNNPFRVKALELELIASS